MTIPTTAYWMTTELTPQKAGIQDSETGDIGEHDLNMEQRRAALSRAHEIRKFEIELYWKRATYFWILQAAVFTAIGLTWKYQDLEISPVIPLALAALGFVTSLAGWLSAKGSKFWQENWEHHIDMLEDEFEGRLHKTAYVGNGGLAWSVSGVNDRLAVCFGIFWAAILLATIGKANPTWGANLSNCFAWISTPGAQTIMILIAMAGAILALSLRKTGFENAKAVAYDQSAPTIDGCDDVLDPSHLPGVDEVALKRRPFLVRREPKT